MKKLMIICFLLMAETLMAQHVSKEFFEQSGSTVRIFYTLNKAAHIKGVDISLNGGATWSPIRAIEGDLGERVPSGQHEIVWNALKDFPEGLEGDQIRFRVNAGKPIPIRKTFVLLGAAYSTAPQTAFGITVGRVKRVGWYCSAFSNFNFISSSGHANRHARITGSNALSGYLAFIPDATEMSHYTFTAGMCIRMGEPLWCRIGAGYGSRNYYQHTADGSLYYITDNSYGGLSLEASLDAKFGGFTISAGVHTIFFQYAEARIGIGWSF